MAFEKKLASFSEATSWAGSVVERHSYRWDESVLTGYGEVDQKENPIPAGTRGAMVYFSFYQRGLF